MSISWAKGVILVCSMAVVVIRAPHLERSRRMKVVNRRRGALGTATLILAWAGFVLPLIWAGTPALAFADYALRPAPFVASIPFLTLGLSLLYRAHKDLGANWSITLKVREKHRLVMEGIYRHIRHPMYLALILYYSGQALVVPNWLAGPAVLLAFSLLVVMRVGPEERLMLEEFGTAYEAYMARTRRLIPGLW